MLIHGTRKNTLSMEYAYMYDMSLAGRTGSAATNFLQIDIYNAICDFLEARNYEK